MTIDQVSLGDSQISKQNPALDPIDILSSDTGTNSDYQVASSIDLTSSGFPDTQFDDSSDEISIDEEEGKSSIEIDNSSINGEESKSDKYPPATYNDSTIRDLRPGPFNNSGIWIERQ